MGKNGYHSYRGRRSAGRSALTVALVVVLAAACAVLFLQRYIIYSDDGGIRLELPFSSGDSAGEDLPNNGDSQPTPPDMNLVIEGTQPLQPPTPESEPYQPHRLVELKALPADVDALRSTLAETGATGFVYTVRDNTGRVFYDSAASIGSAAVGAAGTAEQLTRLCQAEDVISVARFNCFHDSYYAWVNMESAGICQSNGYIWYDNTSYHWLDPAKEQARTYVIALALECAQMGFDELLLEEMCYPTQGKVSKIDYSGNTMGKAAALELFMSELRQALEGYDMKITLLADQQLLAPDNAAYIASSGQDPQVLLPAIDAVCLRSDDAPAAEKALSDLAGQSSPPPFIPLVDAPGEGQHWLIPLP